MSMRTASSESGPRISSDLKVEGVAFMDISRRAVGTAAIGTIVAASGLAAAQQANAQAATDSTFDRGKPAKLLRVAALPGESPYFNKNIATGEGTGIAVEMA